MINLNSEEFVSSVKPIFNNGIGGEVKGVSVSVEKRKPEDPDNAPNFKIFFTDKNGASVNLGIYYPTEETSSKNKLIAQQLADIVRSVTTDSFQFPTFSSYTELINYCVKTIHENASGKLVDVIATYGTKGYPKKYIGMYKIYNFIQSSGSNPSKLRIAKNPNRPEYDDLLEPVEMTNFSDVNNSNTSESLDQDLDGLIF